MVRMAVEDEQPRGTRTYYRGPRAVVTGDAFIARGEPTRVFRLADLANVTIVRAVAPRHVAVRVVQLALIVLAGVLVVVLDSRVGMAGAAVLLVGTVVAIEMTGRHISWELHGRYQHGQVTLFISEALPEFNQVCRALRRSMEQNPRG